MSKHPKRELILYADDSGMEQREGEVVERNGNLIVLRDLETGEEVFRHGGDLQAIA